MRPSSLAAEVIRVIGEDGATLEEIREATLANEQSLANRICEMKYDGLLVVKYQLTEAGKRELQKLHPKLPEKGQIIRVDTNVLDRLMSRQKECK